MAGSLYKVGDIVQLKSGGPPMAIRLVQEAVQRPGQTADPKYNYSCQWFSGKKLEDGSFPEQSLQPAEPDDKAKKKE